MKNGLLLALLFLLVSCASERNSTLKYSTTIEALEHYKRGWVQIMDEGRYGDAEISYRKVLEQDPDFLVGKSVLARLTLDLGERLKLYEEIQKKKSTIKGDESLILEVYTSLVKYTNLRDQGSSEAKNAIQAALQLAEKNFKKVVHKYPEEVYLKAEYIEILHSLYGPAQALDSLNKLSTTSQKDNPFLLGFAASMHAELEEYDIAMKRANRLLEVVNDSTQPKTFAVLANIYFQMENLVIAKKNADRANQLDPNNLDASRLKKKIDKAIEEQNLPTLSDTK
ncbi:tetratricopeptide repeat protein [Maribacter sp. 2308TA10-17]|uniref:tetratricopeptide repeat protein n=1 Tax=Maribacter sp. 2308TA10-17 TaxID=3386276 RepID=UPI0039BD89C6